VFANVPSLASLTLSCNRLAVFPVGISQCKLLTRVDLSRNQLTGDLADEVFAPLINLETLDVSGNQISSLPRSLFGLLKMESLFAYDNAISVLPSKILWEKISIINVSNNQLKAIPLPFLLKGGRVICGENPLMTEVSSVPHQEMTLQEEVLRQMAPEARKAPPTGHCDFCGNPYFEFWIDVVGLRARKKGDDPITYTARLCKPHLEELDLDGVKK
jgi:Leucine-rich repeat (LRR) protein